jgi:hypothetical protein
MDSNNEIVQKDVVINGRGQRSELLTERRQKGRGESGLSIGPIAIIAILAITVLGMILYIVSNRITNESANRSETLQVASQPPVPSTAPQPAQVQQAPVIIQQPDAPAQQPTLILQQPIPRDSASDDANMQEVATRRLVDEPDMSEVSITISEARAVLTGTVSSAATKTRAERLVKGVRGMKSVDNKIVVTG